MKLSSEQIQTGFLYCLFFSLPFSIAGSSFAIIGLYMVAGYRLAVKKNHWVTFPFFYGLVVFLIGALLSALFSADPLQSLQYFKKFWRFGLPLLIFWSMGRGNDDKYLRVLLYTAVAIAGYALIQFFTGLDILRPEYLQSQYRQEFGVWFARGAFSHHLTFGGVFLLLFTFFLPQIFTRTHAPATRWLYGAGALMLFLAALASMGRSIWLASAVSLIFLILFMLPGKIRLTVIAVVMILAVIFVSSGPKLLDHPLASTGVGQRIVSMFQAKRNLDRLMMWQAGIAIIKDHPILGIGPGMGDQMLPYYQDQRKKYRRKIQHHPRVGVHNLYLQTWISFGLLGIIGYLAWWLAIMIGIFRRISRQSVLASQSDAWLLGILSALLATMVAGGFENNFFDGEVQTVILTLMGLAIAHLQRDTTPLK